MYTEEGNAKHKVLHKRSRREREQRNSKIVTTKYTVKKPRVIDRKKSLYCTTGHASFRPFGGIDDDLTDPVSTLVP